MTFEEDFPSLHLRTWIIGLETDVKNGTIYGQRSFLKGDDSGKYIKKKDIQEYCLDKQKVKEILISYKEQEDWECCMNATKNIINRILKELGLEDE